MNIKEIKEILNLMRDHDLCEIELEKEGMKLKLRKNVAGQVIVERALSQPVQMAAAPQAAGAQASAPAAAESAAAGVPAGCAEIKSPMVGTFYSSPAPDQPPYVEAGQVVKEGDVLCIIEAMKLMNEIKAEFSGIVEKTIAQNGDPVEFDQPLFLIKKA